MKKFLDRAFLLQKPGALAYLSSCIRVYGLGGVPNMCMLPAA